MWEFMSKYAENFWQAGEYAFEVFKVIMAWAITLGAAYFVFYIFAAIREVIRDNIRENREEGNVNG